MKKLTAVLLTLVCIFALCACSHATQPISYSDKPVVDETPEITAGIPNSVREVNAEELCIESGLTFVMPMSAQDVHCSVIDSDTTVYEMSFKLDGRDCTVRAAHTDALDESISGVYTDWSVTGDGATSAGDPICFYLTNDESEGVYYCFTDGVTWCVYMTGGASTTLMSDVLRGFVPSL